MDSKTELLDNYSFLKEDQLIPKTEPIDVDFIKKEEIDDECYVEPGVTVSLKVDKVSVKEEISGIEEIGNSSSLNVWKYLVFIFGIFGIYNIYYEICNSMYSSANVSSGIIVNIIVFSQTNQGRTKKCYVYLERLPEHIIKKSFVKVHNIEDKVSHSLIFLFIQFM